MSNSSYDTGVLRELLVHILLGEATSVIAAAHEIASRDAWSDVIALADEWHTLSRLNQRLVAFRIAPSEPARSQLRRRSTATFMRSAMLARRAVVLLEELNNAEIRSAAFKGLAAMAALHGVGNRTIGDIDVLVSEADLPRAIACLEARGLRLDVPGGFREYVEFIQHSPSFAGNLAAPFSDLDGGEIDIHWGLGLDQVEFRLERVLDRAQTVQLFGRVIRVVAAADGLIFAVHHAFRENLKPESTVKDVLDAEAWCGLLQSLGKVDEAVDRAASAGLLNPLLTVTTILLQMDPNSPLGEMHRRVTMAASAKEAVDAKRMANLFRWQLREGNIDKDVLYLVQPRALRQIAGGLFKGWLKYRRWVESMEVKNTGGSASVCQRLATISGGLKRMSPRRLAMLRALARTKDRITSKDSSE